jgi:hypothetical protein
LVFVETGGNSRCNAQYDHKMHKAVLHPLRFPTYLVGMTHSFPAFQYGMAEILAYHPCSGIPLTQHISAPDHTPFLQPPL